MWTSPNHYLFITITIHFEHKGQPISLLLDFVKVMKSYTRVNLATVFTKILKEFGIEDKVS